MSKRFLFFYTMADAGARIRETVPAHERHWTEAELAEYLGGPFADRSGGLITFRANSRDQAERLVEADPFLVAGLIREHWVKEWLA